MDKKTADTIAEIYLLLPGKNCSDCSYPKCSQFAKEVLLGPADIYDCPHMEDDKRQSAILIIDEYFRY